MSRLFVILLIVVVFSSCETYFKPDVENRGDVLTIEGLITNQPGPHFVQISLGIPYDDSVHYDNVDRYNIRIESDSGEKFFMTEYYRGYYLTDDDVQGVVGRSYRVVIESKDGATVYESEWDLMKPSAPIDSLSVKYGEQKVLRYVEATGYYEEVISGVDVMVSTNTNSYSVFNRYQYDLVCMYIQSYPGTTSTTFAYISDPYASESSNHISIANGLNYSSKIIKSNTFAFVKERKLDKRFLIEGLDYDRDGEPIEYSSGNKGYQRGGFLIKAKQLSLSERCFNFWEAIENQKNASGQIFDPVISQVKGNIHCVSNPDEMVFGCFGASAVSEYVFFVSLDRAHTLRVKPIIYFPDISGMTFSVNVLPDYWVFN